MLTLRGHFGKNEKPIELRLTFRVIWRCWSTLNPGNPYTYNHQHRHTDHKELIDGHRNLSIPHCGYKKTIVTYFVVVIAVKYCAICTWCTEPG